MRATATAITDQDMRQSSASVFAAKPVGADVRPHARENAFTKPLLQIVRDLPHALLGNAETRPNLAERRGIGGGQVIPPNRPFPIIRQRRQRSRP